MCPVFDMRSLGESTWPCCPLETTLPGLGQPHWLAMALGQTVLPSTSLAQVYAASVTDLYHRKAPPGPQPTTSPSPCILPHPHLPAWKEKHDLLSDFYIFDSTLCCPLTARGGGCWGAACPPHCHPCGAHAAHRSCCPWFLLRQEEVMISPTSPHPLFSLSPHHKVCQREVDETVERQVFCTDSNSSPAVTWRKHTSQLG